jgi:hypothetical protein
MDLPKTFLAFEGKSLPTIARLDPLRPSVGIIWMG